MLALLASASLAACGGGSHTALPKQPAQPSQTSAYTGALADAVFRISIPGPATAAGKRRPSYVSSATKSLAFVINTATALTAGQIAAYNAGPSHTFDTGTLPNESCPMDGTHAGNYLCTVMLKIPPGDDNITISAHDNTGGTGNVLSQQIQTFTVVVGTTNSFTMTLDANANTMVVSGTGSCTTGPVGASFSSVGTTTVNFTVAYADAAAKKIVAPGLPVIAIQDNTAAYKTTSGTISGTGGTVAFTINQAAQSFTLTPSTSSITNATVNVRATAANTNGASDGLPFTKTQSFTFATGPAPPASFLAVIEQLGTNSGKIDLFTVALGGSGAADSFTAYNVSGGGTSLSVTNSTNEGKPDVDNPRDILFDSIGNLLVANGGQGGATVAGSPDYGDLACVPVGAITTGSSTTTTSSANAFDPESIAIGTDGSVAMANVPASAAYNLVEYVLGTTYAAAPDSRNVANPGGAGGMAVVALPTLATGTFAVAITNGTTISRVVIKRPDGSETDVTDAEISNPKSLGWDAQNRELAVTTHANTIVSSINHNSSRLLLYGMSPPNKVNSIQLGSDPRTPTDSYMYGDKVAVSADGHVAVSGRTADGPAEVRVFDNSAGRNAVGGPIPFDSYTNTGCTAPNFGNVTVVYGMRWLSNTKLLIALGSNVVGKQGVYIYDISSLVATPGLYQFDGLGRACHAVTENSPQQTGFQAFTNPPLSAVWKP